MSWKSELTIRKYNEDITKYRERYGKAEGERIFFEECRPYGQTSCEGNLALREGILALFTLLIGGAETAFSSTYARIGVGSTATAAADTQTGLLDPAAEYADMDTGYPAVGALADKNCVFQGSFGDAEGNMAWEEWSIDNGSVAGKNLQRKVESLGTKSSGTWTITATISLA